MFLSRDSLYQLYIISPPNALSAVRTTMVKNRMEARASFCKSIMTSFQNRLPLWTISLALEPTDCVFMTHDTNIAIMSVVRDVTVLDENGLTYCHSFFTIR